MSTRLIAMAVDLAAESIGETDLGEASPEFSSLVILESHDGGQRSRDSKKAFWAEVATRNRQTGLATLEKTYSPPATLPDLQTQAQN